MSRPRFTVRTLMVLAVVVALLATLAFVDFKPEGPDYSHLEPGQRATVSLDAEAKSPGGTTFTVLAGTRVIVVADIYDDSEDGSPEGRSARPIQARIVDGKHGGMIIEITRRGLRP